MQSNEDIKKTKSLLTYNSNLPHTARGIVQNSLRRGIVRSRRCKQAWNGRLDAVYPLHLVKEVLCLDDVVFDEMIRGAV